MTNVLYCSAGADPTELVSMLATDVISKSVWYSEIMCSELLSNPWSHSFVISIYPAAHDWSHVLMPPSFKTIAMLLPGSVKCSSGFLQWIYFGKWKRLPVLRLFYISTYTQMNSCFHKCKSLGKVLVFGKSTLRNSEERLEFGFGNSMNKHPYHTVNSMPVWSMLYATADFN